MNTIIYILLSFCQFSLRAAIKIFFYVLIFILNEDSFILNSYFIFFFYWAPLKRLWSQRGQQVNIWVLHNFSCIRGRYGFRAYFYCSYEILQVCDPSHAYFVLKQDPKLFYRIQLRAIGRQEKMRYLIKKILSDHLAVMDPCVIED